MTLPGAHREAVWTRLMRERACAYPLPPHGHHPNFIGAREAAHALLSHPEVARHRTLIVGGDRVLYPLRKLALASGLILYVPHQTREGWYWRLSDPAGAQLRAMARVGEPRLHPEGAGAAVLACVAVDRAGGRLGKGFGWGARGLGLGLPEYTLVHPLMLADILPCLPDSRAELIGLPGRVLGVSVQAGPQTLD
ncbi:5-formyltetrahydrofolate cyclo-ligase [Deinococcus sp. SDU3-2]|uniref:5-formyltetrahydrofolate cyclo-ligase n=1 Tax=Deinococcus terrestris TaxID=2651870 RepID=A0A7X1TRF0_9DEIO|nr:5-formyltetrahydrofolate cyclo-ligase [Deinococcus terrestris]MPY66354.1 5-formyltetrahydrofolate cyclo-ligase [Deinococcus terrestris]